METIIYMIATLLFFGGLSFTVYLTQRLKASEELEEITFERNLSLNDEVEKLNTIINKQAKELSKLGFYIDGKGVLRRTKKDDKCSL